MLSLLKDRRLERRLLLLGICGVLVALTGCGGGGGGGGGGNPADVIGKILRAETDTAPNPAATVTIGNKSATAAADGTFTLLGVKASETTATIAAAGSATRTLTIALTAGQSNDLGTVYISDDGYTANVTGRVITQDTDQPVGNATVTIAGATVQTQTNGTFTLTGLPIGLGNVSGATVGSIKAAGFEDKPITSETLGFPLVTGNNPIGDVRIASPVGTTPPTLPYTITGKVTVQGQTPTGPVAVSLTSGGQSLGTTTTDANGNYFFWVVPDSYQVTALFGALPGKSVNVTLTRLDTPVTANIDLTP